VKLRTETSQIEVKENPKFQNSVLNIELSKIEKEVQKCDINLIICFKEMVVW